MARYRGPACKPCRREGVKLFLKGDRCFTPKCAIEKRNNPPGAAPMGQRPRQRMSQYAVQLREKQKVRRIYGVLERQFRRHFRTAQGMPGMTGENLLRILETRLDNVVFRTGFATSRQQARQIVQHGHIEVNGRRRSSSSAQVKLGDIVSVREKSKNLDVIVVALNRAESFTRPAWLDIDAKNLTSKVVTLPDREHIDAVVNEQLIIEHYSR